MSILKISDDEKGVAIGFGEQTVLIKHGMLKDANNIILYLVEAFNDEDGLKAILEKNPKHLGKLVDAASKWLASNPNIVDLSKELIARDLWILKSKISERIGLSVISYVTYFSPRYISVALTLDGMLILNSTFETDIENFDVGVLEGLYDFVIKHYGSEEEFIETMYNDDEHESRRKYSEILYEFKKSIEV